MDPELAKGGEVHPLMIFKIKKTEHPNPIQQTLARFETETRINLIKQKARDCEEYGGDSCENTMTLLRVYHVHKLKEIGPSFMVKRGLEVFFLSDRC